MNASATHTTSRLSIAPSTISSFDRFVLLVILVLAAAVGLAVLRGDQIGVRLARYGPTGEARASTAVTVRFSEEMDRASAASRFRIEPAVPGDISWSGPTLTFRPSEAMEPGRSYTVTVDSGARSESGRQLIESQQFAFTVQGPRVAYLAPVDSPRKNVWAVNPTEGSAPQQLTHSSRGVISYDVSPDGSRLAYAEVNEAKGSDLKLLDLDTGDVRQLTTCGNSLCIDPVWSPDSTQIAFSRQGFSVSPIPGVPRDDTRVWLLDPTTSPASARALFTDPQVRAHYNPRWSPDGTWIAVSQPTGVSNGSAGVLLYNFQSAATEFHSTTGPAGAFSADSAYFFFPALSASEGDVRPVVQQARLGTPEVSTVSEPGVRMTPVQIDRATLGSDLIVAQRAPSAEAGIGQQLYRMELATGALQPLLVESNYDHQAFAWDTEARYLVMERSLVRATDASQAPEVQSQIWLYDTATGDIARLAPSALRPRWLP